MPEWDLDGIVMAMHQRDAIGFLDVASGQVRIDFEGGFGDDDDEREEVVIPSSDSRTDFEVMAAFARAVAEPVAQDRLQSALDAPHPFRRFRDAVHATEYGPVWSEYQDAQDAKTAIAWLRDDNLIDDDEADELTAAAQTRLDDAMARMLRVTQSALGDLEQLERALQTAERRRDAAWLDGVLAEDFEEVGASGCVFDRSQVIALLAESPDGETDMHDLTSRFIAPDIALVRWASVRDGIRALRTSLWRRDADTWRLVHHQGTPVPS